ncbi:MAG: transposase [Candidatus Omnitrophica bacterium]|nr:transposase [Candidatus Omnitrophota bacterium]
MARPLRLQGAGLLYHVTSRGDDRKKIFIGESDFNKFLEYLKISQDKYNFYLYAYCLMGNHYHLLLETSQPNLSKIMQYINTSYTIYYNKKNKKCGHLFQGRYKSILVEADVYFKELTRYIHLNPVRAKIVAKPDEYRWSSYNDYLKAKNEIIDIDRIKILLDMDIKQYPEFVISGINKSVDHLRNSYAGIILGGKKFIQEQLEGINFLAEEKEFARKNTICGVNHETIIAATSKVYHVEPELLFKAVKKPLLAKKTAVYLLKRYSGLTNQVIGSMFGISYSAVSKINKDMQKIISEKKGVKKDIDEIISHFKV